MAEGYKLAPKGSNAEENHGKGENSSVISMV